ncbi:MAG: T9SS type A sorting domain-containing protein [Bacteroidota bacterium]|nr:T9SS type A sorting domain-containing protein [Bacteroidota bacterium]MDP4236139.1 T9SS type A sorting domain-containing protein [Bacteroidota bacterium]
MHIEEFFRPLGFVTGIAVLFLHTLCAAQPAIQWQRCLGGSSDDLGYSIVQTSDGGYAVAGYTSSNDGDAAGNHNKFFLDGFVARLDKDGTPIWKECLGGGNADYFYSIIQSNDGGFVVAGSTQSNDGDVSGLHGAVGLDQDAWIVKLDANGKIEWQRCFGGSIGDQAFSIVQTSDGGYVFAGSTSSNDGDASATKGNGDIWVVKLNSGGAIEWQKCYGGSNNEVTFSIIQTQDGGYFMAGVSSSNDGDVTGSHNLNQFSSDIWVLKLDQSGSLLWEHSYGGTGADEAWQSIQTSDGGYAIAGFTRSSDGDVTGFHGGNIWDVWILRLDAKGDLVWQKCLGGSGSEEGMSLVETADGGIVYAGCCASLNGDPAGFPQHGKDDVWLVKLSPSGVIEWQEMIGGSLVDFATQLIHTSDGGYAFVGWTQSDDGDASGNHKTGFNDIWVVKLGCTPIPTFAYIKSAQIQPYPGDSVDIPIYFNSGSGPSSVPGVLYGTLNLSMNTDLITPIRFVPLAVGLHLTDFVVKKDGSSLSFVDSGGLSLSGEMLIGTLRCATYLSDTFQTSVKLTDGSLTSTQGSNCLSLATTSDSILVTTAYQCGDSLVSRLMRYDSLPGIVAITPNPARQVATVALRNATPSVSYELFDAVGVLRKQGRASGNSLTLDVSELPAGEYYFRLSGPSGPAATQTLIVSR